MKTQRVCERTIIFHAWLCVLLASLTLGNAASAGSRALPSVEVTTYAHGRPEARPGEPAYPVKVSENRRYFTDQKGKPLFWLGTTQWQLVRDYTLPEAKEILEKTREKGFTFAQVMLVGVGDGTRTNVYGEKPWTDNNPLTPNEAYFRNVDAVLGIARAEGMVVSLTMHHQTNRKYLTVENARAWARWVARRYKDMPNLVWCMVPEARQEFIPVLRELAAGLHEGDGGCHLVTVEPDSAPFSSSFLQGENWLDFNCIQTWKSVELIYPMVTKDYHLQPVKPVLMAEGAYEHGSECGFEVTPQWVRRQAHHSYLAGGHHAYGHNDSWRVLPTWRQALDAPGAVQMGILKRVFLARREWWKLVPDQSILASGGATSGQVLNLAARHADGQWLVVYLGGRASFSVDLNKLTAARVAEASWFDPRTGQPTRIGRVSVAGQQSFSTPAGWEDALFIVEPPQSWHVQPMNGTGAITPSGNGAAGASSTARIGRTLGRPPRPRNGRGFYAIGSLGTKSLAGVPKLVSAPVHQDAPATAKAALNRRDIFRHLPFLAALLLSVGGRLSAAESTAAREVDRETVARWSAPYRGWHYRPEHVIPAEPNIPSFDVYYCACGNKGRGIGLITSKPL